MQKKIYRRFFPTLDIGMISIILTLAWPTMLEQLMQTAVQYIDTAMVGTLGTQATAAVGATSTVSWLIGSSLSALSIGFLAFIARAFGAREDESARCCTGCSDRSRSWYTVHCSDRFIKWNDPSLDAGS